MKYALTSGLLSSFVLSAFPGLSTTLPAQACDVFGKPVNFQGLEMAGGTWILRSSLTEDGLTLYYDVWSDVGNALDLFIMEAKRKSTRDEFQGGRRLHSGVNKPGVWIYDPAISQECRG